MNKLKILVVDDESRMRKLVRDFLVKQNFEVVEAGDGEEALNLFLTTHLVRQHRNKILRAYILCRNTPERQVLGYYTLCGSCFERAALPSKSKQKKIPYKNFKNFRRTVADFISNKSIDIVNRHK